MEADLTEEGEHFGNEKRIQPKVHETQNIFGVSIVNLKLVNLGFEYAIILILIA